MTIDTNTAEIFYDTETTGPEPTFDQILQFAAIRTDEDFQEIEAIDERSRLLPHIVPTPGALKVTHLNPYDIARAPRDAFAFAQHIAATLKAWSDAGPTDFSGWNTLHYDEEILRRMFWLNLLDPYATSGRGKRRVDYLTMTRALAARNPEILEIPTHPDTGKPNFKLENIAIANGFSDHNAHDALGDVRATIHMARFLRDTDPALFAHVKTMGAAQNAIEFVEGERLFRTIGGPMVSPGILDVALIATDPKNPKAKTAWNLAVDPTPFLTMTPEEILAAMKKSGTPFRSVKCHKTPLVFPIGWEFLRHAAGTEAPTPDVIDARAAMVMEHDGFRANVVEALRQKAEGYEENEHLEQKIYDGFPSHFDKQKMGAFQNASSWERRLDIARTFEQPQLQQIGLRLVWAHAPEVLSPQHREAIDGHIGAHRLGLSLEQPWTTVGMFMKELEEWEEKLPGDEELATIRAWALETYPMARAWDSRPKEGAAPEGGGDLPAGDPQDRPVPEQVQPPVGAAALPEPHFLDGID